MSSRTHKKREVTSQRRDFKKARAGTIMIKRNVMGGRTRNLPAGLRATGSEIKALDIPSTAYAITSTGVVTPLNLIQVGSSFFNRIGRRIEMKSIRVSGDVNLLRTVATEDYARIMIVYDRQTNGAVPTIQDILQTTTQAGANSTTSLSGVNLNNRDRFKIIRDKRLFLPAATDTAGVVTNAQPPDPVTNTYIIDMFAKLGGLVTQYKADSSPAVIGDIATGGLFLVTFGLVATGGEGYQAGLECRLRFNDH